MKGIRDIRLKRLGRSALLLAVVTGAASASLLGTSLLGTGTANAAVGKDLGKVALTPGSGATSLKPTWSTSEGCPAGFQGSADLEAVNFNSSPPVTTFISPVFNGNTTVPFSGTLRSTMSGIQSITSTPNGSTQEFVVFCHSGNSANTPGTPVMDTFIQWSADGKSYTETNTPPSGPAATTTTLTVSPSEARVGQTVTVTATVTGAG